MALASITSNGFAIETWGDAISGAAVMHLGWSLYRHFHDGEDLCWSVIILDVLLIVEPSLSLGVILSITFGSLAGEALAKYASDSRVN